VQFIRFGYPLATSLAERTGDDLALSPPDHIVASRLRALISIPRRAETRLILQTVKDARAVLDDRTA